MPFVNVGAYVSSKRPASKKALKEAVKNAPDTVVFDATSMYDTRSSYSPTDIPNGTTLSVTGPDPFTNRKWYASVKLNAKGAVTVT